MKILGLCAVILTCLTVVAQVPHTYGLRTDRAGRTKGIDCRIADDVKGCNLFNELFDSDDTFARSFLGSEVSLACFVTDDTTQAAMFFVFSLALNSNSSSSLVIYREGILANTIFFNLSRDPFGAFEVKPSNEDIYERGGLDEAQFFYHRGVYDGRIRLVNWDYWYFDINMKTGRLVHGVNGKLSTGRCARHDLPKAVPSES